MRTTVAGRFMPKVLVSSNFDDVMHVEIIRKIKDSISLIAKQKKFVYVKQETLPRRIHYNEPKSGVLIFLLPRED